MLSVNRLCVSFAAVSALILTSTVKHPFFINKLLGQRPSMALMGSRTKNSALFRNEQILRARNSIARDVIRGQTTLLEAASAVRGLEMQQMGTGEFRRRDARNEADVLCQRVIHAVAMQEPAADLDRERVVCELEAELYELRNQPGGVQLPSGTPRTVAGIAKRFRGNREIR